jgi:hypothetical protein
MPDMDVEALIASYEERKPLYTEGDFLERFTLIKAARTSGISGGVADRAPDDRMVALLASGRVSDAEYFRLARALGVDSAGLIYAEPPARRSLGEHLRAALHAFGALVAKLRRA